MRVAVLGTGRMGGAVAHRLLDQGHEVAVWNRTPGRVGELVEAGATECRQIAPAVHGAEVVMTLLSTDDAVRDVALGASGVVESLGDQVYIESSTISPGLSEELSERCAHFLAMPIAGSPAAVRAGSAAYLVGGPTKLVDRITPVLDALSETRHVYPEARQANVAKLTGNLLLLAGLVSLAEGIAVGRDGGLTDDQLHELLESHAMLAPGLRNRLPAVLDGSGEAWWTNLLGAKDATLALEIAAEAGDRLPVAVAVRERYAAAIDRGLGAEDIATVARLYA